MSGSASSLSDLRQYRFKKNLANNNGENSSTTTELKIIPGRKRIHAPADSSSDEGGENSTVKNKPQAVPDEQILTVKDKEIRLKEIKILEPDYDTMVCQDALVKYKWDVAEAIKHLKENCSKKRRIDGSSFRSNSGSSSANSIPQQQNGSNSYTSDSARQNHSRHQKQRKRHDRDSDDSDGDDQARHKEKVFNSDDEDSDSDVYYVMTSDRKNVFNFLNTATTNELLMVKSCSLKKIEAILESRPFKDWTQLMEKMRDHRLLSPDLLNNCQEFLKSRNCMTRVMKSCEKLVNRLEKSVAAGGGLLTQPANLNPEYKLADYQLVGLNWLAVMHNEDTNGILADEMGLGKTIQVIAFLAYLKETNRAKRTHLIVVPASTMENWVQEFARWCPSMIVEKYYGAMEERRGLRIRYATKGLQGIDVLITTYSIVGSTPEERKMFRVTNMHYVIFDEAHMLKNMTTQRYANLFQINAERRLLLTGTPLQNNLLELMSLLCFVMPSLFANKTDEIKSLFQKNKQIKGNDEISTFEQDQIAQAKKIMQPFLLRRLKNVVLNSLPKKTSYSIKVPMSDTQKEKYKEMVLEHSSESGIVRASFEQSGISIMMDMRKLANHPLLMRYYFSDEKVHEMARRLSAHPLYKKNPNPEYIFEDLAILSDFQLLQTMEKYNIGGMQIPDNYILDSGKFKELDTLLPKLKSEGHRVLIFSQFVKMLDILERYLDIREYGFLRLDGSTTVTDRQDLIDQYMNDSEIFVFLLSTKAGGLGINLTAADTVIIHDIDFNPYNDKQAEDRCHRMGQKRPVTIYRMVSEGSIEEGMLVVAQEKLNLEKEVTTNTSSNDDDENSVKEQKCMIRLLTMALGMADDERAESMLSPKAIQENQLALNGGGTADPLVDED